MTEDSQKESLPHWDLSNVYPALDSDEFKHSVEEIKNKIQDLATFMKANHIKRAGRSAKSATDLARIMGEFVGQLNDIELLFGTTLAFIYSFISTDSYNAEARRVLSELEIIGLDLEQNEVLFKGWLGSLAQNGDMLKTALTLEGATQDHAFYLKEMIQKSQYLMSEDEESLTSELELSGGNAWSKLQAVVSSQVKMNFERDGQVEELPITVIQNFYNDPDESVRRQAYEVEMEAWESVSESMAAALNGIKGAANTIYQRRGRPDYLHSSLELARIDREILEAMHSAMRDSFPDFRRYWHKKASLLGKEKLAWWDLSAPVGQSDSQFTYDAARDFIVEQFASFSPKLVSFTEHAFANNWIDAEPRDGKSGGAFCMPILALEESRILCNFDGSMDSMTTLAHELGHAYHNDCFKGKTLLQRRTPMTLAETASIFNQTIITNSALNQAHDAGERLAILESFLADSAQVIVDIYSRFLFESEVFERRVQSELSSQDFCDIMIRCQKETYGDGLDNDYLHPYMWAWKSHYYSPHRSFYNYPYAFGLLFGLGLYAIYQDGHPSFVEAYDGLLANSGSALPLELATRFEIDLRQKSFWEQGLDIIRKRIDMYIEN